MAKIYATIPVLPSTNFDRTAQFYAILGFDGPQQYPDYLIMRRGEVEIHFFLEEGDPTYGHGHSHFGTYIRVSGLDDIYTALSGAGIALDPPSDRPWGQRELSVLDPDGSFLRFGEPINP